MAEPLIRIENVEKVYRRDQIEIPVLMGIQLDIPEGEYVALMGPVGLGQDDAAQPHRRDRPAHARADRRRCGRDIATLGQTELAQWRSQHDRLHLPALQPAAGADRVRERRAAAPPDEPEEGRAQEARRDGALASSDSRDRMDHYPAPALRGPGAARRDRAGHRVRSEDPGGRRAHGRPRREVRRRDPGAAPPAERGVRQDDRHGHARSQGRLPRPPHGAPRQGRPPRRRAHRNGRR